MNSLSVLTAAGHRHGALDIHPYFGRMDPALATALIKEFSAPYDHILDPFCGSGTVLHEALLAGRSATGWDSSSLACMIAAAKTCGIGEQELELIRSLSDNLRKYLRSGCTTRTDEDYLDQVPPMPRVRSISKWFNDQALRELVAIQREIEVAVTGATPRSSLLLRTAFSRCLVRASNQKGESKYVAVEKPAAPGRVIELFLKALQGVVLSAQSFDELSPFPQSGEMQWYDPHGGYRSNRGPLTTAAIVRDSRTRTDLPGSSLFDMVVTSPPYLMSWDYGLYHKFRFYWLGLDLDTYEDTEIGRHLRRKGDDVERYTQDMNLTMQNLKSVCKPGAHLAFVNATSAVGGRSVDTSDIIVAVAREQGLNLVWRGDSLHIPGPHHGMYASLESRGAQAGGESGKREHVIILQKTLEL